MNHSQTGLESQRTLEPVGKSLGGIPGGGHRAIEGAVHFVLVRVGLQSQAPDTAGFHAPTTAGPAQAAIAADRGLLLEGVAPPNMHAARAIRVSAPAASGAGKRVGAAYAAHVAVFAVAEVSWDRAVEDGTASLASIPFLGELAGGTCWGGCV